MTREDVQTFRNMADQSRRTAGRQVDTLIKAALLRVADEFDGIAERVSKLLQAPQH